jgi:parallel beta-helix repeat protein
MRLSLYKIAQCLKSLTLVRNFIFKNSRSGRDCEDEGFRKGLFPGRAFCLFFLCFFVFFCFSYVVFANDCFEPYNFMEINSSLSFCNKKFDLFGGIKISGSDIVIDCRNALLVGNLEIGRAGITLENVNNVTIKNCNIVAYDVAIFMKNATNCNILSNNFVKGKIGIRIYDSFENVIKGNFDSSTLKPISSVNSRFNVVLDFNKDFEEGFCEFNICTVERDLSPCVDDDSYCSPKCNSSNDNDCINKDFFLVQDVNKSEVFSNVSEVIDLDLVESGDVLDSKIEEVVDDFDFMIEDSFDEDYFKRDFPWGLLIFFMVLIYFVAFFYRRFFKRKID